MGMSFEEMLNMSKLSVERYVKFKLGNFSDCEDVLQDIYFTAYRKYGQLNDASLFKPWILSIARNKVNDYYRSKALQMEIPLDEIHCSVPEQSRFGIVERHDIKFTLSQLADKDKQILYLYYWRDMPQSEISQILSIPIGTVKSRLNSARKHFQEKYTYHIEKGEDIMKKLPKILPKYEIKKSSKEPFSVVWEELMGWFLVPKLGEKLSWGMYDMPERILTESDDLEVVGKAIVHGIEGVEIKVKTHNPMECNSEGGQQEVERGFVAQLTNTHCRYLAESHTRGGINYYYTFLDSDEFTDNWGFGENNCGHETHLSSKGDITRNGDIITGKDKPFLLDIVGRYDISINGKTYDTVCVIDIETYNTGMVCEWYLDKNGRTILWRRFNQDDWAIERYKKPWSELLPNNEKIIINGKTFVHWYDCITDYIL